jgi:hypothetical protein
MGCDEQGRRQWRVLRASGEESRRFTSREGRGASGKVMALDGEGVGVVQCLKLNPYFTFHPIFALFEHQRVREDSSTSDMLRCPASLPKPTPFRKFYIRTAEDFLRFYNSKKIRFQSQVVIYTSWKIVLTPSMLERRCTNY